MNNQFSAKIKFDEEQTVIELSVPPHIAIKALDRLVELCDGGKTTNYEYGMSGGWASFKDNSFHEEHRLFVCTDSNRVCFIAYNEPDGDDIFDGSHEHWSSMNPNIWPRAVSPLKKLIM